MSASVHKLRTPTADYAAGKVSPYHKSPRRGGSADASTNSAGARLRDWARWLDENLDIVTGAMDKLANFIVGTGINIQPMVRRKNGELAEKTNSRIRAVLLDEDNPNAWSRDVNVTGGYTRGEQEWTTCRTWLRDGDILGRRIPRKFPGRAIPYKVQLIEADHLPYDLIRHASAHENAIIQGVEVDEWSAPVKFHLYREHPGGMYMRGFGLQSGELLPVAAAEIAHLKYTRRRIGQTRGVPIFHSAIFRLDDIADYEDAHRIGARVAAQLMGAIKRAPDMLGEYTGSEDERSWEMEHGQIISDLLPGEDLSWYKPESPNPDATPFLDDQMRRVAPAFSLGYSTFSGKYDKSFSAARQEQSENWPGIETLRAQFISDFVRPVEYEPALNAAILAGAIRFPRDIDTDTIYAADYRGPARPVIDDEKQARGDAVIIETKTDSRVGRIRERGRDHVRVDAEIKADVPHLEARPPEKKQNTEPEPDV